MNYYDVWLGLSKIHNKNKKEEIEKEGSSEAVWYKYTKKKDIYKEIFPNEKLVNKILNDVSKGAYGVVCILDKDYPEKLKPLNSSPFLLFYKGDIDKLNISQSVGIVGSRSCTNYGESITYDIVSCLAQSDINIISGMAKGIDGIAHRTCIDFKGFTCGVLGTGIDGIYPKINSSLFKDVELKGCLVSEFLPGSEPFSKNFPIRNRIISGLSDIVIVVEASIKSGSLITAGFASEQGRAVFAVPGSIYANESQGTNKLIQDGAAPFLTIEDLQDELNLKNMFEKKHSDTINLNCEVSFKNKICSLINENPIHIDDIIRLSHIDINRVYEVLFEMQFKNEILCLAGNYYVRNINNKARRN